MKKLLKKILLKKASRKSKALNALAISSIAPAIPWADSPEF